MAATRDTGREARPPAPRPRPQRPAAPPAHSSQGRRPAPGRPRRRSGGGLETATLAGVLLFLLGAFWDVAWHVEVGRDTFWSPPHLLIYLGVLIVLGSSAAALVGAWRRRGDPGAAGAPGSGFRPPAGATISAIGAVLALAAGPVDDLWHRLYGVDVTILSPPHLLLATGMAIATFGAIVGCARRAARAVPARLTTLWPAERPGALPWARGETGLYAGAGLLLTVLTGILGEYDFDVSRYPIAWHPVLLAGLSAVALALAVRAGGRVGAATLAATAYVFVRLLAQLELILLTGQRPQIPLLLVAAPALDLVLWGLTRTPAALPPSGTARARRAPAPPAPKAAPLARRPWLAAPLAGAAYAALLLLVQWPYTAAAGTVIWSPDVLARAALPALLAGAAGALLGWALGVPVRPVTAAAPAAAGPAGPAAAARARRPAHLTRRPLVAFGLAVCALLAFWVLPTSANAGALPRLPARASGQQASIGQLVLDPAVPVAGQPLTVTLTVTDPFLINNQSQIPFESVRAGDTTQGVLRGTSQPGVYTATFTPKEPGRRWLSAYLLVEEVRTAASAGFVVYPPGGAAGQPAQGPRPVVLRPEPGPDPTVSPALQPVVYVLLAVLLAGAVAGSAAVLRAENARLKRAPAAAA